MDFDKLFKQFSTCKVGVVGDVMLDTYWWGHVERISPEAPVPVVLLDKRELRIGGAGNVALNLVSLGASTSIFSVIGEDDAGRLLDNLMQEQGIDTSYIICSSTRKTTDKMRIISRNQQMMRLDAETTEDLAAAAEEALIGRVTDYIVKEQPAVIIFEDYNKGVLTQKAIHEIIRVCKENNVVTAVDPKRKNFFAYKGVTIFKPNLKEVKDGLNLLVDDLDSSLLKKIHALLQQELQHTISFITLSEKGVFYQEGERAAIIPSHFRRIADVSGAGDTVIAVAALLYASTADTALMAAVANIAGGLVCEEVGTAAINKERLLHECKLLLGNKTL
ncbi:MAG TPA: PfkB family carbohydrate kinase [Chitinophagaceae bacterium]|jgi:rfaE bifunctional protein kinase chain/domain|nr:PfkB family carbohydrate kinase [Chitinophagaceae bacterium]